MALRQRGPPLCIALAALVLSAQGPAAGDAERQGRSGAPAGGDAVRDRGVTSTARLAHRRAPHGSSRRCRRRHAAPLAHRDPWRVGGRRHLARARRGHPRLADDADPGHVAGGLRRRRDGAAARVDDPPRLHRRRPGACARVADARRPLPVVAAHAAVGRRLPELRAAATGARLAVDALLDPAADRRSPPPSLAAGRPAAAALRVADSVELQFRERAAACPVDRGLPRRAAGRRRCCGAIAPPTSTARISTGCCRAAERSRLCRALAPTSRARRRPPAAAALRASVAGSQRSSTSWRHCAGDRLRNAHAASCGRNGVSDGAQLCRHSSPMASAASRRAGDVNTLGHAALAAPDRRPSAGSAWARGSASAREFET